MKKRKFLLFAMLMAICLLCNCVFSACGNTQTPPNPNGGNNLPKDDQDHYITNFEITTMPTKLIYGVGESFNLAGIDVKLTWEDNVIWTLSGGDITIADLTVRPSGALPAGTEKVEVIFDEYVKEIPITIQSADNISIEREPAKLSYTVGELFNTTGLIVKVNVLGGNSFTTENYDYSPKGALTKDDKFITITYEGKSVQLPITVTEPNSSFYMEAEDAELIDGSGSKKIKNKKSGSSAGWDLCAKASGEDFVVDAMPKDSIKFTFTTQKSGEAKIVLTASSNATEVGNGTQSAPSICNDMQVNKVYDFYVNGTLITIADSVVLKGVTIDGGSRETWVYWRIVEVGSANLLSGENVIELKVKSGGGYTNSYGGNSYGQIDALNVVFK